MIAEQYLLAAACLAAALTALQPRTPPAAPAGEVDAAADQHVIAATLTRWNPAGDIDHELTAERLDIPGGGDRALLTGPRLRVDVRPRGEWLVRAESGYLSDDVIELDRRVAAEIDPDVGSPLRLHTEHLSVDPTDGRAWSDRAVRIETPHSELRGRGLRADLANGRVQLLEAVRGAHEPKTN